MFTFIWFHEFLLMKPGEETDSLFIRFYKLKKKSSKAALTLTKYLLSLCNKKYCDKYRMWKFSLNVSRYDF